MTTQTEGLNAAVIKSVERWREYREKCPRFCFHGEHCASFHSALNACLSCTPICSKCGGSGESQPALVTVLVEAVTVQEHGGGPPAWCGNCKHRYVRNWESVGEGALVGVLCGWLIQVHDNDEDAQIFPEDWERWFQVAGGPHLALAAVDAALGALYGGSDG